VADGGGQQQDDEAEAVGGADRVRAATGGVAGARGLWNLERAREATATLKRIRRAAPDLSEGEWLRTVARKTMLSRGPDGKSGAMGQFVGHHFERLDVSNYNLRRAGTGRVLRLRAHAHAPGFDADRFVHGRYAGSVQHKLGPNGVRKAATKVRSARRVTVRVPKDRAAEATRKAAGEIRVQGSKLSTNTVKRRADAGLKQVAKHGDRAASGVSAAGRAAGGAAVLAVAAGAARDARRLYRHEMSGKTFAVERAADAVEAGASAAATVGAGAAIASALTTLAGGTGTVAAGAGLAASSTVLVPLATGVAVGVVVTRAARPLRTRASLWVSRDSLPPDADPTPPDGGAVLRVTRVEPAPMADAPAAPGASPRAS
jgi:hypothetical protein